MSKTHDPVSQVLILGLDTFAKKNISQIRALESTGYEFVVATNDQRADSAQIFGQAGFRTSRLVVLPKGILGKLSVVSSLLGCTKYNHVELYAAGRMTFAYLALAKLYGQRIVVVERGDIGSMRDYGFAIRQAVLTAFRLADAIIYKEIYMETFLRSVTERPLHFVPNCVENSTPRSDLPNYEERDIDFIWVNRIIPQRRAKWVISAFGSGLLASSLLKVIGFERRNNLPEFIVEEQERCLQIATENVEILTYTDPERYLKRSKFFCLPAEFVFGNNALLEAMSYGVVPVVTDAPGVERLVVDGANGIVTEFDEAAYHGGLERAAKLDEAQWRSLSDAAVDKVEEQYSLGAWTQRMNELYRRFAQ